MSIRKVCPKRQLIHVVEIQQQNNKTEDLDQCSGETSCRRIASMLFNRFEPNGPFGNIPLGRKILFPPLWFSSGRHTLPREWSSGCPYSCVIHCLCCQVPLSGCLCHWLLWQFGKFHMAKSLLGMSALCAGVWKWINVNCRAFTVLPTSVKKHDAVI